VDVLARQARIKPNGNAKTGLDIVLSTAENKRKVVQMLTATGRSPLFLGSVRIKNMKTATSAKMKSHRPM
jgi:hypothetical protein